MPRNKTNKMSILKNLIEKLKDSKTNLYLAEKGTIRMSEEKAVKQLEDAKYILDKHIEEITKCELNNK